MPAARNGRYRLTPLAEEDLENIWLYGFKTWSMEQADDYHRRLMTAVYALADGRREGLTVIVRDGYRKHLCGEHVIYYRLTPDHLDVMRILHQMMDAERHL